jgi:hypothetical protein
MCRNIKPLFNFDPPVSEDEIRAAAIQYVRKVSGSTKPSKANETAYQIAIDAIETATSILIRNLQTSTPPRNREVEISRAKLRAEKRFAK